MIGIVADIDDDVCCEAVAICCAFVELLISLSVLPERYGIPMAVVPERFGVVERDLTWEGLDLNMTNTFSRAA